MYMYSSKGVQTFDIAMWRSTTIRLRNQDSRHTEPETEPEPETEAEPAQAYGVVEIPHRRIVPESRADGGMTVRDQVESCKPVSGTKSQRQRHWHSRAISVIQQVQVQKFRQSSERFLEFEVEFRGGYRGCVPGLELYRGCMQAYGRRQEAGTIATPGTTHRDLMQLNSNSKPAVCKAGRRMARRRDVAWCITFSQRPRPRATDAQEPSESSDG
ncbi:hypothetical protein C8R43DRAFT_944294 [Mycena crocata]|nr:hypothetical protein C8R43DRAFT_944294 [Mycena crocata]